MILDAKNVRTIFTDCLCPGNYKELPSDTKCIKVEGIVTNFVLMADKVENHAQEIKEMLDQLQPEFNIDGGGGYTFLNMPFDRFGKQWGEQLNAQELMVLGIASGWASYLIPKRDMWRAFPGGVPYVVVNNVRDTSSVNMITLGEVRKDAKETEPDRSEAKETKPFKLNFAFDGNFLTIDYCDGSDVEAVPCNSVEQIQATVMGILDGILLAETDKDHK